MSLYRKKTIAGEPKCATQIEEEKSEIEKFARAARVLDGHLS